MGPVLGLGNQLTHRSSSLVRSTGHTVGDFAENEVQDTAHFPGPRSAGDTKIMNIIKCNCS